MVLPGKFPVTGSLYETFRAVISKHYTFSHIISPVVFVLLSNKMCIGKPLTVFVIGKTIANLVRM
jgi:hypothetical protein